MANVCNMSNSARRTELALAAVWVGHAAGMALAGMNAEAKSDEIVSLPEWQESLQAAPALAAQEKLAFERAILGRLRAC